MPKRSPSARKRGESPRLAGERDSLAKIFGRDGALNARLRGYEPRQEQIELAETIERAINSGKACLTEAGTGVGKTFAYLIPAIRAALKGKKTVVTTHTISLQTQLIEKDIPFVLSLFADGPKRVRPVLMKGRGNYLCKLEMENVKNNLFLMADPTVRKIRNWANKEECSGDVADLPFTYGEWSELAANLDTCRGPDCGHYQDCFYYRTRRQAQESGLIVVNHALFLSDLAVRAAEAEAGVLPTYDHVVIDEAHHFEEVATKIFGVEFASRRLTRLAEQIRRLKDLDIERSRLDRLEDLNSALFSPFLSAPRSEFFLEDAVPREEMDEVSERAVDLCVAIEQVQKAILEAAKANEALREKLEGVARMCGRARDELHLLFFQEEPNLIRWGDVSTGGRFRKEPRATLHLTPISVADTLKATLWDRMEASGGAVVMTSATLSNSGSFDYVRGRIGAPDNAIELIVGSPFDYKRQAMLYVPGHLPPPDRGGVDPDVLTGEIERVVKLTEGRAFLLFTSWSMMNQVYERLAARLEFPLFKQGDMPAGKLIEAFKASGNGCLFGVQTFWEGIDVQGEALSCVVIDRLPFAVPDSPVIRARTKAITDAGGDWFKDFSVPQAQIRLKQGFGRLIRTRSDRGIVCILDSRMISKNYGAEFVKFLPPASRASKWSRVTRFWEADGAPEPSDVEEDAGA